MTDRRPGMADGKTYNGEPRPVDLPIYKPEFVPPDMRGLWRRTLYSTPAGTRDVTTHVFWLQTHRFYADLRIPAARPDPSGKNSFEDYSDDELLQLAQAQGFGGTLTVDESKCLWRRDFDYQPQTPTPDEANCRVQAETLIEEGVHSEYTEVWEREYGSGKHLAAFVSPARGDALLVIAGNHFIVAHSRLHTLPPGAKLGDIVEADLRAGRRGSAASHLAMPICFGCIASDPPWRISLSTLPWLEGGPLFPSGSATFDPEGGVLTSRSWGELHLLDTSIERGELSALFSAGDM